MQTVEHLLGTRGEVSVVNATGQPLPSSELAIVQEAARLEHIFSAFDVSSDLHQLRKTGTTEVTELLQVLELATTWQERSNGAFHCGVQPLFDLWNTAEANNTLPTPEALLRTAAALQNSNTEHLNLNAIAKGWIAQSSLNIVSRDLSDGSTAWVNLGGDIVHRGKNTLQVSIENPHRPYDNVPPLASVAVSNEALATSGGSRRWWTIQGVRYPQVLDPRTGRLMDHMASATVVAPDAATADVLATVAIVAPATETLQLVEQANAHCLLVSSDGTITTSSDRFRQV